MHLEITLANDNPIGAGSQESDDNQILESPKNSYEHNIPRRPDNCILHQPVLESINWTNTLVPIVQILENFGKTYVINEEQNNGAVHQDADGECEGLWQHVYFWNYLKSLNEASNIVLEDLYYPPSFFSAFLHLKNIKWVMEDRDYK